MLPSDSDTGRGHPARVFVTSIGLWGRDARGPQKLQSGDS